MCGHGLALDVEIGTDVDSGGDGCRWASKVRHLDTGWGVHESGIDGLGGQALDQVAVHRRFVDAGDGDELGGACADPVDLGVVGVSGDAVFVVDGENVGLLLGQDGSSRRAAWSPSAREKHVGSSLVVVSGIPESR